MHRGETTAFIPPGSAIVFFTDGLTESTRDIEDGYRRLRLALLEPSVRESQNIARAIVEHVLGGAQARDDIAVLVLETDQTSADRTIPRRRTTWCTHRSG
jgi:serine phosphatase RsbU (regulator of sigma subunit)